MTTDGIIETFTCAFFLRQDMEKLESRVKTLKESQMPHHLAMKELDSIGVEFTRLNKEKARYDLLKTESF